jgi:hypothetical protein
MPALLQEARRRGFALIDVIDGDLGRSASGMLARPGFDRLVAWLCAGEDGARPYAAEPWAGATPQR